MGEAILRAVPDEPIGVPSEVQALLDTIASLEQTNRSLGRKVKELERDKLKEAEDSKHWPTALRLFNYSNRVLNHPRAEWDLRRFEMIPRFLKPKDGLEQCLRAIAGKRTDQWAVEHGHTTFDDIFETRKKFEKCLARCPVDWKPPKGMPG